MADVAVNIKVNADVNALTAIKKELKEMKALALNGDGQAAKRVAELTDKLEDLKDTTKSLKGDGVEKLQNSFGLLKDSLFTGDAGKFTTALKGIGSAMSAIPLLLLVEGFKLLVDNFDKVIEFGKMLFSTFSNNEKAVRSLTRELEKQKEINKGLTAGLEDEIKIIEAQGASSAKIIAKKRELNALKIRELEIDARLQLARIKEILDNDTLIEAYNRKAAAVLSSLGQEEKANEILRMIESDKAKRAKEASDKIKEDIININHLKTEIQVEEIKQEKEFNKAKVKNQEDLDKALSEIKIAGAQIDKENREMIAKDLAKDKLKFDQELADAEYQALLDKQAKEKKAKDDAEKEDILRADRKVQIEKNYLQAAGDLAGLFFEFQLRASEGNEVKQLEIKKRAFNVEKAFRAAQAIIDTTAAVQKTYAAGGVLATPLAISMGVLGAANVAKILATKFNPGSAPSASASTPRLNLSAGNQQPTNQQVPQRSQDSTQFDESGNRVTKVVVLASDIKDVTRSVARVEEQARF